MMMMNVTLLVETHKDHYLVLYINCVIEALRSLLYMLYTALNFLFMSIIAFCLPNHKIDYVIHFLVLMVQGF